MAYITTQSSRPPVPPKRPQTTGQDGLGGLGEVPLTSMAAPVPFPQQFLGTGVQKAATHRVTNIPYKGVKDSLSAMDLMAREGQSDPAVRRYAEEVIRRVYPKDYISELAALYYDVCRRIRYTRDPAEREYVQHPRLILRYRVGDCDDQAILLRSALGALGLAVGNPMEFVIAGFDANAPEPRRYTHVFLRAYDSKVGWLVLDPVAGPNTPDMLRKVKAFRVHQM
jgi:transglutaminase-like putative cysteine protease